MIIVPINPINLDQTELLEQKTSLKNYFINYTIKLDINYKADIKNI